MLEIEEAQTITNCINLVFPDYRAVPASRDGDPLAGDDEDYVIEVVYNQKGLGVVTYIDSLESARRWLTTR